MASETTLYDDIDFTSDARLSGSGVGSMKSVIPNFAQVRYGLAVFSAIALAGLLCTGLGRGMGKVAIYFL